MIAWTKIYQTKYDGGLGVKDIQAMNTTCLMQLAWKFSMDSENPWIRVFKGKQREIGDGIEN